MVRDSIHQPIHTQPFGADASQQASCREEDSQKYEKNWKIPTRYGSHLYCTPKPGLGIVPKGLIIHFILLVRSSEYW